MFNWILTYILEPMVASKNPLIFVVEDNHVYNRLIVSFLKTNKLTNVESYSTGEEALKARNNFV